MVSTLFCNLLFMKLFFTDDIVQFLSGNNRNPAEQYSSTSSSSEAMELSLRRPTQGDDDSMLVEMDSSPRTSQNPSPSSSDTDLAMYDDPNSMFDQDVPLMHNRALQSRSAVPQRHQHSSYHCGCGLQGFLYHWLALPIQKYRFVVLVVFIIVLGTSIGLDVQIQPSTKPPAFFKESTNLQQLLDLKYNMSSDSLNLNNVAPELIGKNIQSNFIDSPITPSTPTTKKGKESNGLKTPSSTPTPSPATAEQSGSHQKTNILGPKTPKVTPAPTKKPVTQRKKKSSSAIQPSLK